MPLARRSLAGVGKEEIPLSRDLPPPRFPETGEKSGHPQPRVAFFAFRAPPVEGFQGTVLEEDGADAPEEPVNALPGDEPVGKPRDPGRGEGAPRGQGRMGGGPESPEHPFEERQDLDHVAESEGGRQKRGDLDVRPVPEPVGEPHGVGRQIGGPVGAKGRLERLPETIAPVYGITLLSGYSTIPEAPEFFRMGMSSRTVFSSTITSRLNQPAFESDAIVGF